VDHVGRLAAGIGSPRIENLDRFLRDEFRKIIVRQWLRFGPEHGVFGAVTVLIGQDEIHMATPTKGPIAAQTSNGREVVRLLAQSLIIVC
jgi:hypothetical protein